VATEQVPYDDGEFSAKLSEFEELLADFKTVMLATDANDSNEQYHSESTMGVVYRTSVTVGEKYPFSLTFELYDFEAADEAAALEHWRGKREEWVAEAREYAASEVAALRPRFDRLTDPWPTHLSIAAGEFEQIATALRTQIGDDWAQLEYSQSHWHGHTASRFFNNYYNKFPICVSNLAWVAEMLQGGCAAGKGVLDMGRNSAMNTVVAFVERADMSLQAHRDWNSIDATEFLTIASTVLGLLDLLPIVVPSNLDDYIEQFEEATGDARGGAAAAIGYAEDLVPEADAETFTVAKTGTDGLMEDLYTSIGDIESNLDSAWQNVDADYTSKVRTNIQALESMNLLWLPNPDVAQGPPPPGEWYHESSNQYTG
jgi:hypothetical protein